MAVAMSKTECVPGRRVVWLQVPRGGYFSPERLLPVEGESFAHAVATSRGLAPEERDFWLRVCEAEGK
jgi:hypothetical protein